MSLVISRKRGEKIYIGVNGEICVEVLSIRGDQVRLGIVAPKEITVLRQEPGPIRKAEPPSPEQVKEWMEDPRP